MGMTPLGQLGRDLARAQHERSEANEALRDVEGRLFDEPRPRPAPRPWLPFAAAAIVAAIVVAILVVPRDAPLTFSVDDQPGQARAWIRADESVPLRFSDGSSVVLRPGTLARVVSMDEHGAEVAMDRGSATIAVEHREQARWTVAAGPYDVRVTGTRFDVSWSPEEETLRVEMFEGSVEVRGPTIEGVKVLVAGQSLRERRAAPAPEPSHTERDDEPAPSKTSMDDPDVADPPTPSASAAPKVSWRDHAAHSDFDESWALAQPQLDAILSGGSAQDLATLADVARYAGQGATSMKAYRALRKRHAGTPQAARAAYALGRATFGSNKSAAVRWFQAYLAEAPGAPLAREALGRILEAQQGTSAGASTARQYLRAYPQGPHAKLAHQILGSDGAGGARAPTK
jgi:transmembrane sensor